MDRDSIGIPFQFADFEICNDMAVEQCRNHTLSSYLEFGSFGVSCSLTGVVNLMIYYMQIL
jgi:hypothetical protein